MSCCSKTSSDDLDVIRIRREDGVAVARQQGTGPTAIQVSAGGLHTCALLDETTLKCWGLNSNGQLGLGNSIPRGLLASQMGDALGRRAPRFSSSSPS